MKIKKISIASILIFIASSALLVTGCSRPTYFKFNEEQIAEQRKQTNIYYNDYNAFNRFFVDKASELNTKDSNQDQAIDEFEQLETNNKTWDSFNQLQHDLTTTKLSNLITTDVNWEQMMQKMQFPNNKIIIMKNQLLNFYNIIGHLYHKENVLKLLQFAFVDNQLDPVNQALAYNSFSYQGDYMFQGYHPNAFKETDIERLYQQHHFSSDSLISTVIHEYGHALSVISQLALPERDNLNKKTIILRNNSSTTKKLIFNDPTEWLINFLDENEAIPSSRQSDHLVFPLLVVNSIYSQSSWIFNNVNQRDEFFAEAIARWIGTNQTDQLQKRWFLLNKFFTIELPKHFKMSI